MNRGADGDDFVRIDTLHRVFAEELFDALDDGRHTGHTANHNNFVDVLSLKFGIFQSLFDRTLETIEERRDELLKFSSGQSMLEMLRAVFIGGKEREINICGSGRR